MVSTFIVSEVHAQFNSSYFYARGREYIIAGRYRDAIESLNILLRSQPQEYEGYFLRGVAKYNLGDLYGANQDFTKILDYNPVYTMAYQYRGIALSRLGQYDAALADFSRALEMRPNFAGVYYSRAVTNFLNQKFAEAISDYDYFLELEPHSAEGFVNRGTAKLYLKDSTAAMVDYNRAIEVNPYFGDGYLRRGVLYMLQGDTELSIADMDSALELDSTAAIGYFYRAMGNNRLGEINSALSDFDKAVIYDPTNSVAIFNRAILRSQIGDYNRAIEDYSLVAAQNPQNVLIYYNRAAVYAQLGDVDNAIADYTRAIEIYGDFANAYLYRSSLKAQKGDRQGYYSDKQKAEDLISKYRREFESSGNTAFSDTSARFSDIISFNADFEQENLARVNSSAISRYKPQAMFRMSVVDTLPVQVGYDPTDFYDEAVQGVIQSVGVENVKIENASGDMHGWKLMRLDTLYAQSETPEGIFARAMVNSQMRNFSLAMDLYGFLIADNPYGYPLAYLNRAVTNADRIEFMAAVEGDYQNMSADSDPASRLRATSTTNAQTREIEYRAIIADLEKCSELLPQQPYSHFNLGYMHTLLGDLPTALAHYTRAIELYPYFAEAYYNRALLQLTLDEKEKAGLDLSRAGELGFEPAYAIIDKLQ